MKNLYGFILLYSFLLSYSIDSEKQQQLHKITSYKGTRTFLVSYPRSGNSWMRYALEVLTERPTFHRADLKNHKNYPVAWICNFFIDCDNAPIEKAHNEGEMGNYNPEADSMIFLLRNPKEAISRHEHKKISYEMLLGNAGSRDYKPKTYFNNLALFDRWPAKKRLLIYYEDLMTNPRTEILKILVFLGDPQKNVKKFFDNYEKHQNVALKLYGSSESHGEDLLFHSRKNYTPEYRKKIDLWIELLYPKLWNKYLKNRYSEENLIY